MPWWEGSVSVIYSCILFCHGHSLTANVRMFWGGGWSGSGVWMQGGGKAPLTPPLKQQRAKNRQCSLDLLLGGEMKLMYVGFFQACHVDASEGAH